MIASAHVLNKLSADSEIIVANAAGMSPWRLFSAFFGAAMVISIMVTVVDAYISPECTRALRRWAAEVRTDLITNIVQPGRFTPIESGLTFHVRERQANGLLVGVFVDDARNSRDRSTILAEHGYIAKTDKGPILILENGTVQRRSVDDHDPRIVAFDRYAVDLSQFQAGPQTPTLTMQEEYLWDLLFPSPTDQLYIKQPNLFRAELYDRLAAPIYPLAFAVIIYAFLGAPRTTREGRSVSLVSAVLLATGVRLIGFISMVAGGMYPFMLLFEYVALAATFALGLWFIGRGAIIEPPAVVLYGLDSLKRAFARPSQP